MFSFFLTTLLVNAQREQFLLFRIRRKRDQLAYGELYKEYASALRRFLVLRLPTPQDADDALSTTFLRAWNYLTVSPVESVSGLLFTIARGVVSDFFRANKIETVSVSPEVAENVADPSHTARRVEAGADIALVKEALKTLSDEERAALSFRFFEGLPVRDIAAYLQKTENATRVLIHRSLKNLRAYLDRDVSK